VWRVTTSVCELIQENGSQKEFTEDWQIKNNLLYKDFLEFSSQRGHSINYELIAEDLKSANLNNGLNIKKI